MLAYQRKQFYANPSLSSIKPTLKKVSKYENKFAKLQKKAAEFNFRNQLKTVKKKEFTMDEEEGAAVSSLEKINFFKKGEIKKIIYLSYFTMARLRWVKCYQGILVKLQGRVNRK